MWGDGECGDVRVEGEVVRGGEKVGGGGLQFIHHWFGC